MIYKAFPVSLTKRETFVSLAPLLSGLGLKPRHMKGLLSATDRTAPARLLGGAFNRRQWVTVTLRAVAAVLFAPCGTSAQSNATIALSPTVAESTLLSALDPAQEIRVVLTLPLGDPLGAEEFARRVSNPGDPLYRHYISPEEFGARYGANVADYHALKAWAVASRCPADRGAVRGRRIRTIRYYGI